MEEPLSGRTLVVGLALIVLVLGLSPGFGQVALIAPEDHQDFISALSAPDLEILSSGPSSSPMGTGRPPRVGPNVRANAPQVLPGAGLLGRSETTVAATDDGQLLVAGFNDAQGFCGPPFGAACTPQSPPGLSGYAFSNDAGLTWTDGGAPQVINHVFTRGDPWLALGGTDNATFFYANLAVDDRNANVSFGVSVHRGHFSGGSFSWSDLHTFNAPAAPTDFYDKEAIAARPGTPDAFVSVTNFIGLCGQPAFGFGQIEVWRTHDGGGSWQGPVIVSPDITFITNPATPGCGLTGTLQQSSVPAVGPNGEVYVVWQRGPTFAPATSTDAEIDFARSLDGGVTFSAPTTVAGINSLRQDPPVGYNRDRINDHPRIAVAQGGKFRGRVYVVYYSAVAPTTQPPATAANCLTPVPSGTRCRPQVLTSSQVFLRFSDDKGVTWSSEIRLAPAVPATGIKRWWPVVSVEPGGSVDVIYYESQERQATANTTDVECNVSVGGGIRRQGLASSLVDTFWVRSTDGGATFSAPMKVSTATSNWCTVVSNIRPNFGDYIGSMSGGNRVFPTWADGRNDVPDTFYSTGLGAGKSTP